MRAGLALAGPDDDLAVLGSLRRRPTRAVRPCSAAERTFLALGPTAEAFLRAAAAAGTARLASELAEQNAPLSGGVQQTGRANMKHRSQRRQRMKKLAVACGVALMAYVLLAMNPFATSSASADNDDDDEDKRLGQSDHALWGPGDTNLYCGVGRHRDPWTLHISATTGGSEGTLTITFRDGSAILYNIRGTSSFSATNAFGGVPFVDDVVKITPGGGVVSALASALVRSGARDPFADDREKDNFCLTKTGDPGTLPGGFPLFGSPNLP